MNAEWLLKRIFIFLFIIFITIYIFYGNSYYNYDLATTLLRDEWKYDGVIITDWWMKDGKSSDFENITNQAYRIRAQVDVFMPGSARVGKLKGKSDGSILSSLQSNSLTRGELQRSAINVLNLCMKKK